MPDELSDRLEIVNLENKISQHTAIGRLRKRAQDVLVTNGSPYMGQECLARFDQKDAKYEEDPKVNRRRSMFITSHVPDDFPEDGLAREKYIFVGQWERRRMRKEGEIPTIEEVRTYFDPGHLIRFGYSFRDQDAKHIKGMVHKKGVWQARVSNPRKFTIPNLIRAQLIERGPCPWVMLTEQEADLEHIKNVIRELELWPIEMEPLQ